MEILEMNQQDVEGIFNLECECFSSPWSKKSIEDELSNPLAKFFVAHSDGCVVGYIGTHTVLDECYITNIAVSKNSRGRGIGTSLLKAALSSAGENGASFITLEVRQLNLVAIGLYKKLGFEPQGIRKKFYESPQEDGVIMTKNFYKSFKEGEVI